MVTPHVLSRISVLKSSGTKFYGRIRFWPWAACFCIACLFGGPAQAAITTSGNIVPSYPGLFDPWIVGGSLYIADTSDGSMTVNGGSDVIDTDGWIGRSTGANGTVTITGSGSTWESTENLSLGNSSNSGVGSLSIFIDGTVYVGDVARSSGIDGGLTIGDSDGSGSTGGHLNIYNGSTLTHGISATLGNDIGEYAWATVDGTGSLWNNSGGLMLGYDGSGTLTVQNGGSVSNVVALTVGCSGSGTLTVQNGGSVSNSVGRIGWTGGTGTATVDGSSSSWTNSEGLSIGLSGSGTLTIQNGGSVSNTDCWLSYNTGGTATVTVTGSGSTWENTGNISLGKSSDSGVGSLTISDGGTVYIGDAASSGGTASRMTISDTDVSGSTGGHLYIYNGSTITHGGSVVIGDESGEYGWSTVDGTGSSWTNGGDLHIGYGGTGTLTVQNGGSVSNTDGRIGSYIGSIGTVTITDSGSTWESTDNLSLGNSNTNAFGSLTISDGATVYVGDAASSGGSAGRLTVSDSDSSGTDGGYLYIYNGSTLTHGDDAVLGDDVGEYGWATVDGSGSSWTNDGELSVGLQGSGTLTVQNGGSVSNTESLYVALSDSGTLTVQNGGSVSNTNGLIGYATTATGTATIGGTGSTWTNDGWLYVGVAGSGELTVHNGGSVSNTDAWIGSYTGGTGTVTVTGNLSTWENTGNLSLGDSSDSGVGALSTFDNGMVYVGDAASSGGMIGWRLTVSDSDGSGASGGHLYVYNGSTLIHGGDAVLGDDASEFGWATVDGSGSSWTNGGTLFVGFAGSGTLTIQNGGSVSSTFGGWIGYSSGAAGTVTVDGTNSTWENSENLSLGRSSASGVGHLTISDNGTVYVGDAARLGGSQGYLTISDTDGSGTSGGHLYVYNGSTLTNGSCAAVGDEVGEYGWATVDGAGSSWTNGGSLWVGYEGAGTLTVQNGGSVSSHGSLDIGCRIGSGMLTVSGGGSVSNYNGSIGLLLGTTGTAMVDGVGSSWANSGGLSVGYYGSGTLTVQNGGSVSNTDGWLGHYPGGTGTVTITGSGSTWENTSNLSLGNSSDSGAGSLTISGGTVYVGDAASSGAAGWLTISDSDSSGTAGGNLYVYNGSTLTHGGSAIVGNGSGEYGWATVDGNGSSWTNGGSLYVGSLGSGTITVQNEGNISISGWLYVGDDGSGTLTVQNSGSISGTLAWLGYGAGSTGTATVDGAGSAWTNSGSLAVGDNGSGTLTVSGGGSVSNASGRIGYSSGSDGTVTVDGIDSSWTNGGSLTVGRSGQGTLTISAGGLVSVAGTLTIDYNTDGDSHINMKTGGMLALSGDADDSLSQFLDLVNGTDAINYWDDSISDWADISVAMRYRDYMLSYLTAGDLNGYTLLTVQRAIDGDANGDGKVDVSDLGILATNYGTSGCEWGQADFTGEGDVDVSDLGVLATNYGNTAATTAQSVPEPGILTLLTTCGLALLGLIVRGRKR